MAALLVVVPLGLRLSSACAIGFGVPILSVGADALRLNAPAKSSTRGVRNANFETHLDVAHPTFKNSSRLPHLSDVFSTAGSLAPPLPGRAVHERFLRLPRSCAPCRPIRGFVRSPPTAPLREALSLSGHPCQPPPQARQPA